MGGGRGVWVGRGQRGNREGLCNRSQKIRRGGANGRMSIPAMDVRISTEIVHDSKGP